MPWVAPQKAPRGACWGCRACMPRVGQHECLDTWEKRPSTWAWSCMLQAHRAVRRAGAGHEPLLQEATLVASFDSNPLPAFRRVRALACSLFIAWHVKLAVRRPWGCVSASRCL